VETHVFSYVYTNRLTCCGNSTYALDRYRLLYWPGLIPEFASKMGHRMIGLE
jgi:hypothetical protein